LITFEYEIVSISVECSAATSGAKSISATVYALIQNVNKMIGEGAGKAGQICTEGVFLYDF
jgi:hypothetical protein